MQKLVFAYGEDWEAMYIGDRLVLEGHSLAWQDVLAELGLSYEWIEVPGTIDDAIPETLTQLKADLRRQHEPE